MNKVSVIRRPSLSPEEEAALQEKAVKGLEVTDVSEEDIDTFFPPLAPVFVNDVPKVRTDRVIKPKGMPPADWDLVPVRDLK